MRILGIETSCDETSAAIVENGTKILSQVVASSLPLHAKTAGIIPEVAAREQVKAIIPVIETSIRDSKVELGIHHIPNIDAVAVTYGPGLIGSLLVGVEAAKTLSYTWQKPLIPINHLVGHFYSAWLEKTSPPSFPFIALIVSGGHTELLFVLGHGKWQHLGGTRDDAAGEAFDKGARVLGLGYPGGPAIEKVYQNGNPKAYNLPRPLFNSLDYDFSFSGLKTALVNLIQTLDPKKLTKKIIVDLSASFQEAIVDILVKKTISAATEKGAAAIVLGGGVAANRRLREKMKKEFKGKVFASSPNLSIDNGAMIASAAFFNFQPLKWGEVKADASILF